MIQYDLNSRLPSAGLLDGRQLLYSQHSQFCLDGAAQTLGVGVRHRRAAQASRIFCCTRETGLKQDGFVSADNLSKL